MPSRRFEPASDVAVREIRSRAGHGVPGTFPRGTVSFCVDDDVGVAVENEDGAVGRSQGEEFRPGTEGAQALIWNAGAELAGDCHGVTQRPTGDQGQLEAGVEGQHPGGFSAAEGVSRHTDALPVDVAPGEEKIDAPHRVEDELAHDEPASIIGAGVDFFGVVRPGTQVAADVPLFFSDRVQNQAGQPEFGVELGDVGVLPLAFAAAVAAGDYYGRHGCGGVCGTIEYGGDAGTGFARPDPFFDDDSIPFDLSAGLRSRVAADRGDAQEVVQSAAQGFGLHGNVLWKGSGMVACRETMKGQPVDRLKRMVEAAGIEPASESSLITASTCVVYSLRISHLAPQQTGSLRCQLDGWGCGPLSSGGPRAETPAPACSRRRSAQTTQARSERTDCVTVS